MPAQRRQLGLDPGLWELDHTRREQRTQGVPVPLGGRAFDIVEVLAQSAGELVTKDEIIRRVWSGAIVEESTLQVHISAIRKALGPDRGMLKTAFGRGYRLLGAWTIRQEDSSTDPVVLQIVPPTAFATNFPSASFDLIGRTAVVQHLLDLLSAYRVVTLTGPGGIGKSALALQVARTLFPAFGVTLAWSSWPRCPIPIWCRLRSRASSASSSAATRFPPSPSLGPSEETGSSWFSTIASTSSMRRPNCWKRWCAFVRARPWWRPAEDQRRMRLSRPAAGGAIGALGGAI